MEEKEIVLQDTSKTTGIIIQTGISNFRQEAIQFFWIIVCS